MNNQKINQWFKKRNLTCEENFGDALHRLASEYGTGNEVTLEATWGKLGITKQNINAWKYHDQNSMTQLKLKQKTIGNAKTLFNLNETKTSELAKKTGISWSDTSSELERKQLFIAEFASKLKGFNGKQQDLYEQAGIGKRSFYYIKAGEKLRKESLLALLIVMELTKKEIDTLLNLAGYCLSGSHPADIVINALLEEHAFKKDGLKQLNEINEVLYTLELPLIQVIT